MTELLDCTLRDGGYYTSWDFKDDLVASYLTAIGNLPISMIELGYISPPKTGYMGRYYFLSPDDIAQCKEHLRPDQKLGVMLNAKDFTPELVAKHVAEVSDVVEFVRFAVAPKSLPVGLELAAAAKSQGVETAINVMYMTEYVDDVTPLTPLQGSKDVVDYVALVDSYGGCMPHQVANAFKTVTDMLEQPVGFHGHNNVSMAFANSVAAIDNGAAMIDSTVTGMGRGAGNVQTELMLGYLNVSEGTNVDFARLATIVEQFEAMQRDFGWGPSLPYMVSGFANLPQAEVMDWLAKRRYSASSVVDALRNRGGQHASAEEYPNLRTDAAHSAPSCLIVGGGESVDVHEHAIQQLVTEEKLPVIHASLRNADRISVGNRYLALAGQELAKWSNTDLSTRILDTDVAITTAPPRFEGAVPTANATFQVSVDEDFEGSALGPVSDVAPIQLALAAAKDLGAEEILLAGFDGYETADANTQKLAGDFQTAVNRFKANNPGIKVVTLLPSHYDLAVDSLYSRLAASRSS